LPLYEYLCSDGHTEEHIAPVGALVHRCSCGSEASRVWSTFAIKSYALDSSSWDLIAPLNADGKPMTRAEAARSGRVDRYSPDEKAREDRHSRDQQARLTHDRMEAAKRDGWRDVSKKHRIEVR
jgi:hypothetical protein